jgi:hypothetical protein
MCGRPRLRPAAGELFRKQRHRTADVDTGRVATHRQAAAAHPVADASCIEAADRAAAAH